MPPGGRSATRTPRRFLLNPTTEARMLNKHILLKDLRQTLVHILCKDLEDDEVRDMQNSIDDFMETNATHYSESELIDEFNSAEKILDQFIAHLEARKEMAGQTLH
jgi:predicted transcriptional regulator YheO